MRYKQTKENYPLLDSLAVAVAVDRVQGFIKSGNGYYVQETQESVSDNRTTALNVLRKMAGNEAQTVGMKLDKFMPTAEDRAKAQEIFKHFDEILVMDKLCDDLVKQGKDGRVNDFNLQMSLMFDKGSADVNKELAMLVSLPNSRRISSKRIEMENFYRDNKENGYIGELRKRVKITGRVMDVKFIPKHSIHLATVFTTDGKLAKFFLNDKQTSIAERIVDTDITFVGTVKKQDVNDFTGCQETMFNRIKMDE